MRGALIETDTGLVLNVIVLPDGGGFEAPHGQSVVVIDDTSPVSPGWSILGDQHLPPELDTTPAPVDPLQAQLDELIDLLLENGAI